MTTTTTATRTARPQAPAPTGAAWDFFTARNPQVDQARIGYRWADGVALYLAGAVSEPDSSGARQVRSSRADAPDRQPGEPVAYTVYVTSRSPRRYGCECADFQNRGRSTGACKHIAAVWMALHALCAGQQAQAQAPAQVEQTPAQPEATPEERIAAAVASLAHRNPAGLLALLEAVANHDAKSARTAAARITGWPERRRGQRPASAPAVITQLAA